MQGYKIDFIKFALSRNVLKFGEFTLKSGRVSPYFFNAGLFNTGADLARLGQFYAAAIQASGLDYDVIFTPPTKAFPLAQRSLWRCSTNMALISPCVLTAKKRKIMARAEI